jgi:hypothetical protein
MRRGNAFGRPAVSAINGAERARCQRASGSAGFGSRTWVFVQDFAAEARFLYDLVQTAGESVP